MEGEDFTQGLRLFHYATRLPVCWLRGGEAVASLPGPAVCGGLLMGQAASLGELLGLEEASAQGLQFFSTPLRERFFGLGLAGGQWVLCGPYCRQALGESDVLGLIRAQRLPLDRGQALTAYYRDLACLGEMNEYYASLLLERLLRGERGLSAPPAAPPPGEEWSRHFYQNAYRNRMDLFRHPPYFFEQEISRQIAAGNRDNAMGLLGELNQLERAHLADTPLRSLKNSLIASVTLFTRAAITGGVPSDEAFTMSDSFIQLIERQQDLAVLSAIEAEIILRFTNRVCAIRDRRYSPLIRKTMALIDEYLTEDLSAPWLAGKVYVHPDYLSARFHREAGETLHAFILRRRVEEAAHFMRYSGETVSNIATFYRFSSQSHFIAVFKRFMGATPQRYRQQGSPGRS